MVSEVKPKDKAKDKYDDSVARGDFGAYMEYNNQRNDTLLLALGNVLPG